MLIAKVWHIDYINIDYNFMLKPFLATGESIELNTLLTREIFIHFEKIGLGHFLVQGLEIIRLGY